MVDEWMGSLNGCWCQFCSQGRDPTGIIRSGEDKIQKIHNNLWIPIWLAARGGIPKDLKTFGLSNEPRGPGLLLGRFSVSLFSPFCLVWPLTFSLPLVPLSFLGVVAVS